MSRLSSVPMTTKRQARVPESRQPAHTNPGAKAQRSAEPGAIGHGDDRPPAGSANLKPIVAIRAFVLVLFPANAEPQQQQIVEFLGDEAVFGVGISSSAGSARSHPEPTVRDGLLSEQMPILGPGWWTKEGQAQDQEPERAGPWGCPVARPLWAGAPNSSSALPRAAAERPTTTLKPVPEDRSPTALVLVAGADVGPGERARDEGPWDSRHFPQGPTQFRSASRGTLTGSFCPFPPMPSSAVHRASQRLLSVSDGMFSFISRR